MPVTTEVITAQRLVIATCNGLVSKQDFVEHIAVVWSNPAVAGFDELIDVTNADISNLSASDITSLVNSGVSVDEPVSSRLALCVSSELGYGLARMYGSMRESHLDNARDVQVFYDLDSAKAWLSDENQKV